MPKPQPIILDENCAPRRVLELFSVKWTTMVLHALHFHGGTCRTGALARSLPGCSKKMLTQTLRSLERDGLLTRTVTPTVPVTVTYEPTALGASLYQVIRGLKGWAQDHMDEVSAHRRAYDELH